MTLRKSVGAWSPLPRISTLSSQAPEYANDGVKLQPAGASGLASAVGWRFVSCAATGAAPPSAVAASAMMKRRTRRITAPALVGHHHGVARAQVDRRARRLHGVLVVERDRLDAGRRLAQDLDVLRVGEIL